MRREWKPGDGAILRFIKTGEVAYGVRRDGEWAHTGDFGGGSAWDDLGGFEVLSPAFVVAHDEGVAPAVVDPEDREQVERLTKALVEAAFKHGNLPVAHNGIHGDTTEAALREFANPTPPKCGAALSIKGEHFGCDQPEGHAAAHGNTDAGAIWGESE